jgi:hypothetical protein
MLSSIKPASAQTVHHSKTTVFANTKKGVRMKIPKIPEKVADVLLKLGIELLKILKKINAKKSEKGGRSDNTSNVN